MNNIQKNVIFRIIYQKSFKCQKCGKCCQNPGVIVIHERDVERISKFLGIGHKKFITKYTRRRLNPSENGYENRYVLTIKKTDPCMFHDPKVGCTIHDVKPIACRAFPYLTAYGPELDQDVIQLTMDCIGAMELNNAINCAKEGNLENHPEYMEIINEMSKVFSILKEKGYIDEKGNILRFDIAKELNILEEILGFKSKEEAIKWLIRN